MFMSAAHCIVEDFIGDTQLPGISFAQDPLADPDVVPAVNGIADIIVRPDLFFHDPFTDVAVILLATAVTDLAFGTLPALGELEIRQNRRSSQNGTFAVLQSGALTPPALPCPQTLKSTSGQAPLKGRC